MQIRISEADRKLFMRCRYLNKEIADCIEHAESDEKVAHLQQLLVASSLPPGIARKAEIAIARIVHTKAHQTALEAELEELAIDAEVAAQRILQPNLRRFVQAYCNDGCTVYEAMQEADISERTAYRYIAMLKAGSEGKSNGRASDP